jgi:hypothetical protein
LNRIALALAVLGAPGLVAVTLVASSQWLPFGVAVGLAAAGGLLAIAGSATSRTRVHASGLILAVVGASLTGVGLSAPAVALGVASATLLLASFNLHLVLPDDGGGITLAVAAIVSAGIVAGIALIVARLAEWLGGGGIDATGGLTAWLVALVAGTWGLVRWTQEATPG